VAGLTTPWTKAIDFSGSSERAEKVGSGQSHANPLQITTGSYAAANADPARTSSASDSKPWATAIVFKSDRHSSNQHIWNHGEGSSGDNVFLRTNSSGHLYFGWGLDGQLNECKIKDDPLNSNRWYGVYVSHKGARFSSGDATAANLADAFDIYVADSSDSMSTFAGGNRSVTSRWESTGNRMNRSINGGFSIGGRGSNRSFHGKVASMIVTTLLHDQLAPTELEALAMVRDPLEWLSDYKVGNEFRYAANDLTWSDWQVGGTQASWATQVWLMGDGTYDSYSNMIRNQSNPTDQNDTKLNLISMVSGDIQNVNINGLTS